MDSRAEGVGLDRCGGRSHRSGNLHPGLLEKVAAQRIPTNSGVHIAILENIVVVERFGRTRAGTDAVEVGPPEVVTHRGINGGEPQRVAVVENEVNVAVVGRSPDRPETRVGGGDGIDHGLRSGRSVEAVTPSESRVGLREVDNEFGTVGTAAHPVQDLAEGKGSIDGVSGGPAVGVACIDEVVHRAEVVVVACRFRNAKPSAGKGRGAVRTTVTVAIKMHRWRQMNACNRVVIINRSHKSIADSVRETAVVSGNTVKRVG